MKIPVELAQEIVLSLQEVLRQELNFMDQEGMIIASTDRSRIGQSHAGALAVLKQGKAVRVQGDHQYHGAKKGINVPVFFHDDIIGVIGLTGEEKDVAGYGEILQRMTEILIKDMYLRTTKQQQIDHERLLVERIQHQEDLHPLQLQEYAALEQETMQVVCGLPATSLTAVQIQQLHQWLDACPCRDALILRAIYEQRIYLFFKAAAQSSYTTFFQGLQEQGFMISWGSGKAYCDIKQLHLSLQQAYMAAAWNHDYTKQLLLPYEAMGMGLVLGHTRREDAQDLIELVFHDIPEKRRQDICATLRLYEKHNGSILHCAKELYMHKNSFQYRLVSIKQQTGLDPRQLRDFVLLKTAATLYEMTAKKD